MLIWIFIAAFLISLGSFYFLVESVSFSILSEEDYENPHEYGFPVLVMTLASPWVALVIILNTLLSDKKEDEELINSYIHHRYRRVLD